MSEDDKSGEQSAEEIVAEMQTLMKRQVELQAKLLKSNWGNFNNAMGAFMDIFSSLTPTDTGDTVAKESKPKGSDDNG